MGDIKLTEFGAAETVPGSKLLLKTGQKDYLIDVGKNYKDKEENLPFEAKGIEHLILTHGHADHMGELLKLRKEGFKGKIFSTHETAEITKLQLKQDVSSVFFYNRAIKGKRYQHGPDKGKFIPFKKAEYSKEDIESSMALFESDNKEPGIPYEKQITISDEAKIMFYEAGHIPGSAQILFEISSEGRSLKLLTACDLGRTDYKILGHPRADTPIVKFPRTGFKENIDYIVVESTYGDKVHNSLEDSIKILEEAAKDAAKNSSKLIIPTFSIMRTHMLWNFLFRLNQEGRLPDMTFYSSSPTADYVSKIILGHIENLDEKALQEFANNNYNPFYFDKLVHHKKLEDTKEALKENKPMGIIAASGMCEMGRIVPILERTIQDPKNIILLTGYASPRTRAYNLINKEKQIRFDGKLVELKADVRKMGGLSGHADKEEIIAHLKSIHDPEKGEQFKGVFIKHGEKEACHKLRERIIEAGYPPETVHVMKKNQEYVL
ncbi:MAG: MBL fold metallo-hydrolase [Nanoarchaeota archaeon]|nr:MBL fold metallo-hydrolase [Nanoarchaeota archaeon]